MNIAVGAVRSKSHEPNGRGQSLSGADVFYVYLQGAHLNVMLVGAYCIFECFLTSSGRRNAHSTQPAYTHCHYHRPDFIMCTCSHKYFCNARKLFLDAAHSIAACCVMDLVTEDDKQHAPGCVYVPSACPDTRMFNRKVNAGSILAVPLSV